MRTPFIAGNWKMNNTIEESRSLVKGLAANLKDVDDVDIAVGPPMMSVVPVAEALKGTNIAVAAQNVFFEEKGAFTGEVSPGMLLDAGCSYAIIAHSERRQYFGETNESANKKIKAALAAGLKVIYCVGERLEEREAGDTEKVVKSHVENGLTGLSTGEMESVTIAYEPVWAIGTGKTATPEQAEDVHVFIRGLLDATFGADTAAATRIQYGGSVKPENVKGLMAQDNIDGALVGGASLKVDSFTKLVKFKEA